MSEKSVEVLEALLSRPCEIWESVPNGLRAELAVAMFPSQVEVKDKRLRTRNYLGVTKEDANFEVEGDIKHPNQNLYGTD